MGRRRRSGRKPAVSAAAGEAVTAPEAAPQSVSDQVVGNAFVTQYYYILLHSPSLVHRFYQDISKLGRPEDDGTMSITTTITAINKKCESVNYGDYKAEIKSVDAQESLSSGVQVLVTGYMTGKDTIERNFAQSFFLAPQERGGYFVLNDIFRYITAPAAAPQPVSAQVAANAFVPQYYHILHHSPSLVHRFYQDISKLGRPEDDGTMSITTTMTAINEKVLSFNSGDLKAEVKSVDAQGSLSSGVHVLVTGYMTGKDNIERNFAQSFFLAPQERGGYFVLNDIFRYVDKVNIPEAENHVLSREVDTPNNVGQVLPYAAPVQDDYIIEQTNLGWWDLVLLEAMERL